MPAIRESERPVNLWRNADYLLLQGGQVVSFVGSQVQGIALPLLVLAVTHSATQAGIVLGFSTAAFLVVCPIAGTLVDRWNRRWIMIVCDTGRLLMTIAVPAAIWFGHLTMPLLYVVVIVSGAASAFFTLANAAALPNVVRPEQLTEAIGLQQTGFSAIRLVGSSFGGLLYTIGEAVPFLLNAASFLASVISLSFIRLDFQEVQTNPRPGLLTETKEGLSWLLKNRLLRFLTIVNAADSMRYAAGYLVIIVIAKSVGTSAVGIGLIFSCAAVGALLGSLAVGRIRGRISFGALTIAMLWIEAAFFPLYGIAPNAVVIGAISLIESLAMPMYNVTMSGYRMAVTPDRLRGRVNSSVQMAVNGAAALGSVLGGFLIELIGGDRTAFLLGGWLLVLALATTLNPSVRGASLVDSPQTP